MTRSLGAERAVAAPDQPMTDAPEVLADLIAELLPDGVPIPRDAALGRLRRQLGRIQGRVQRAFEDRQLSGLASARWLAALTDGITGAIYAYTGAQVPPDPAEPSFALVATGGYGRGVLAPFSDIDLLFLSDAPLGPQGRRAVEFMLYLLWDLGLKVGHATRSVPECIEDARADVTVQTALLDARHLAGDRAIFGRFDAAFARMRRQVGFAAFLAAKRAERTARHTRYGESPFLVEPHVKEGRGGLRDLQTLYWLARHAFDVQRMPELVGPGSPGGGLLTEQEARSIRRAWSFFWSVRFHLHYVTGRAEERLTFDLQPVLGARMGYTRHGVQDGVERFMKHLFLTARDVVRLTRLLEPALERAALGRPPSSRRATRRCRRPASRWPTASCCSRRTATSRRTRRVMLRLVRAARDRGARDPPAGAPRADPQRAPRRAAARRPGGERPLPRPARRAGRARWLRVLNEVGFLSRFIPDWARILGLMQFDTYHVFTVDEHTIEAIGVLGQLDARAARRGRAGGVRAHRPGSVPARALRRGAAARHSEGPRRRPFGARRAVALELCPRLGLSPEETETVSWLVLNTC
jgi:[protein-PII] uridylyltransferase